MYPGRVDVHVIEQDRACPRLIPVRVARADEKDKQDSRKELEGYKEEADLGGAFHEPSAEKPDNGVQKNGKKQKTKPEEPEDSL